MERRLIPTGLFVELPAGYELQVRPRSGLALKHGVTVLNTPGTVEPFTVQNGDRIAQAVVAQAVQVSFVQTDTLSETGRGVNGYGSTGIA